jgi:hypothetical protein
MKRSRNQWSRVTLLLLTALATLGCNNSKQPSAAVPKARDPEHSFDKIVENLRHYLEQLQVAPITKVEDGSFSDFRLSRDVIENECIPPTNAGEDYRGKITVAIRWSHSFRPPLEQPQEKSGDRKDAETNAQDQSAQETVREGIEVLDSEAIADLKPGARIPSAISPHVMGKNESEEDLRTFQLVFRNNRWELAEEPKTEPVATDSAASGESQPGDSQPSDATPDSNHESVDNALARALKIQ